MKNKNFLIFFIIFKFSLPLSASANNLFVDKIKHKNEYKQIFTIGTSGNQTADHYLLDKNIRESNIDLFKKGFYEITNDGLINSGLYIQVINNTREDFKIEFKYEKNNIIYRKKNGSINIAMDRTKPSPSLKINQLIGQTNKYYLSSNRKMPVGNKYEIIYNGATYLINRDNKSKMFFSIAESNIKKESLNIKINNYKYDCESILNNSIVFKKKPFMFFDFNSSQVDIIDYYKNIAKKIEDKNNYYFFYYYTKNNCRIDSFTVKQDLNNVSGDLIGTSSESRKIPYYLQIIDNIIKIFGKNGDFTDEIIIVSRLFANFSKQNEKKEFLANIDKILKRKKINVNVNIISYNDL